MQKFFLKISPKKFVRILALSTAFIIAENSAQAQKAATITLSNPTEINRVDELVILKRSLIEKKLGKVAFLAASIQGQQLNVQHDDSDGDGKWDEAIFLYSFKPKQSVSLKLSGTNAVLANAVQRAHVRLKKKNADDTFGPSVLEEEMPVQNPPTNFSKQPLPMYLTEGPGWENDKIAFRLYLDVRNNKDIYAKRIPRMVMDSVGTKTKPSYHDFNDWGMDVLHVVKSLGAGALALWVPKKDGTDTLIRLGGMNVKKTRYKQLSDGPVKASFQLTYDWEVEGKPVQIIETTSIWGGQYFYESKVRLKGAPLNAKLVTGIADFYENVFQTFSVANSEIAFSHGKQSENKDEMGMGIIVPKQGFSFAGTAPKANSDILTTYLVAQDIDNGKPLGFRFYTGWEKTDSRFARLSYFKNFLKEEAIKKEKPIAVRW